MKSKFGFASVYDTRLFYEVAGSGPALVLVHGFAMDSRVWDPQFAVLAAHFRVVRYDLRGFGQSPPPAGDPYSHYADLKGLLDYLQMPRVHVLGHSLGGQVAIDFALSFPDAVVGLVLADAALGGHAWSEDWKSQVRPCWQQGRAGDVAAARASWREVDIFDCIRIHPTAAPLFEQIVAEYSGWHWLNARADPEQPLAPPAAGRLAEINRPTLVLVGEHDKPDFQVIANQLSSALPDGRKVVFPGAGHMSNLEAPALFNEAVLSFLRP